MPIDWAGTAGRLAQGARRARPALLALLLVAGAAAEAEDDLLGRAKAGDPAAQLALAVRMEAKGGDQAGEAILWYARAAARGEARAYYLGQIFETGQGVDRNPALARAWYAAAGEKLAAAAGRLEAMAVPPPPGAPAPPRILGASVGEEATGPVRSRLDEPAAAGRRALPCGPAPPA